MPNFTAFQGCCGIRKRLEIYSSISPEDVGQYLHGEKNSWGTGDGFERKLRFNIGPLSGVAPRTARSSRFA